MPVLSKGAFDGINDLSEENLAVHIGSFKNVYWTSLRELRLLALWFLAVLPAGAGNWLRSRCLRGFLKHLGCETTIQSGLRVLTPELVSIGDHCNLGPDVFITGGGGVTIGNWVGLGPGVKIWSVNHRFDDPDTPWLLQGSIMKEVVIEDDVWLAANVFVMPGVRIGRGAIVSATSLVNKSIPAFAIVAGNPARVVGWRKRPDSGQEPSGENAPSSDVE